MPKERTGDWEKREEIILSFNGIGCKKCSWKKKKKNATKSEENKTKTVVVLNRKAERAGRTRDRHGIHLKAATMANDYDMVLRP